MTKKGRIFHNSAELNEHSSKLLLLIKSLGLNPYKIVQLWKKYRPMVPVEHQGNALYSKPDEATMAKVKDEKMYRAETSGVKDVIESIAFGDNGLDKTTHSERKPEDEII